MCRSEQGALGSATPSSSESLPAFGQFLEFLRRELLVVRRQPTDQVAIPYRGLGNLFLRAARGAVKIAVHQLDKLAANFERTLRLKVDHD